MCHCICHDEKTARERELYERIYGRPCCECEVELHPSEEAGSSSLAFLACSLLALVPVSLVVVFVGRLAGAVAGVMG